MTRKAKVVLILAPIAILLLGAGIQGIQYWWRHGYSVGERSGVIRKMSVKGTPVCKYLSGELVLTGAQPGTQVDVWEFTVDDKDEAHPLMQKLHEAERSGGRVTIKYRQDLPMWWTCRPIEYKVTDVIK